MIPNVLLNISKSVETRLAARKETLSLEALKSLAECARKPFPFATAFQGQNATGILAEIKFKSPALGDLKRGDKDQAIYLAGTYLNAGADALSILTEMDHFQGNPDYLIGVRKAFPNAKILMKDFILDEYQIFEARLLGADCILLIVALLGKNRTKNLLQIAKRLGLSTLIEVHDEEELKIALSLNSELIGVNNRNLKTLTVSIETSVILAPLLDKHRVFLSESGFSSRNEILKLQALGYRGFLVGSSLMTAKDPARSLAELKGIHD